MALHDEIRENKIRIIESVLTIENALDFIIQHYFFENSSEKTSEFKALILNSNWCSFAAKRKLTSYINEKKGFLTGKDKDKFEKLLYKAMSYRNAFAHGQIEIGKDGENYKAYLKYFEGGPQEVELDDNYWEELENNLLECHNLLVKIHKEIRKTITNQSTGPNSPPLAVP